MLPKTKLARAPKPRQSSIYDMIVDCSYCEVINISKGISTIKKQTLHIRRREHQNYKWMGQFEIQEAVHMLFDWQPPTEVFHGTRNILIEAKRLTIFEAICPSPGIARRRNTIQFLSYIANVLSVKTPNSIVSHIIKMIDYLYSLAVANETSTFEIWAR